MFDFDKTQRKIYTKSIPSGNRLAIDIEQKITREELVKRNWNKSNYVHEIISSYLGFELDEVIEDFLSE